MRAVAKPLLSVKRLRRLTLGKSPAGDFILPRSKKFCLVIALLRIPFAREPWLSYEIERICRAFSSEDIHPSFRPRQNQFFFWSDPRTRTSLSFTGTLTFPLPQKFRLSLLPEMYCCVMLANFRLGQKPWFSYEIQWICRGFSPKKIHPSLWLRKSRALSAKTDNNACFLARQPLSVGKW